MVKILLLKNNAPCVKKRIISLIIWRGIIRTLIFGMGILADHRRKGKARMGKNRPRTFSRWHPVGTIVRRAPGAASGEEAAILAASISSRAKRGTGVSKHVWYSWWCYFLRLSHGFGRPAHTANCNRKKVFKSSFKSTNVTMYIRLTKHSLITLLHDF